MKNRLNKNIILEDYCIIYLGSLNKNQKHSHYAIQITISLNNPFTIYLNSSSEKISEAVIIDSNIEHYIKCDAGDFQLVLLMDPEYEAGDYLKKRLHKGSGIIISKLNRENLLENLKNNFSSLNVFHYVMSELGFQSSKTTQRILDDRIQKVLELIPEIYNSNIKVKEIADSVFLSESRLQHLFKEQMFVSFSKYLIWYKMKKAVKLILEEEKSYSYAAMESGFTDYPYMCRTFNHFFGFSPRRQLKNSRIFQELPFFLH